MVFIMGTNELQDELPLMNYVINTRAYVDKIQTTFRKYMV